MIFFFDLETTGPNPYLDLPVEVSAIDEQGEVVIDLRCDPGMPISVGASDVHGITSVDVAGKDHCNFVVYEMLRLISERSPGAVVLAGYNISTYDIPILLRCFAPWFDYGILDVYSLVLRQRPKLPSKKLGAVYRSFFGKELSGAHGALQDCYGTREIFQHLVAEDGLDVPSLIKGGRFPKVYDIMPIGKYTGLPVDEVPKSWALWMLNNATNMRPDLRATVEYIVNR